MTLKKKVAINIAIAFSILFALVSTIIFLLFSSFRKEEFTDRLEEKALTTARLLVEVKEVDNQLLKLIDQNSLNKLYNEKTLIFNKNFKLIYSSIDDASIDWNENDLKLLKEDKSFYRAEKEKDLLGLYYNFEGIDYYIIIAAEDKYGNSKLRYLLYLLVVSFLSSVAIIWGSTYFVIKKLLQPLDVFEKQITNISGNALNVQLHETKENDEINLLTKAFNKMLARIESAFIAQKEFTSNASHELRTPLTRLAFQLENLIKGNTHTPETRVYLESLLINVHQLSDLVNSLLLLSKLDKDEFAANFIPERVDEIIFTAYAKVKTMYPDFELKFEIQENDTVENGMEVVGDKKILEIAFINLLKNACIYSSNATATVVIIQETEKKLVIQISNNGNTLGFKDVDMLFAPFMRGKNAGNSVGSGLGLRITKRILDYHEAKIHYHINQDGENEFVVEFEI